MPEFDLLLMSLVIFVPSAFALALLFFPRGSEEYMRWWTLLGTAVTLALSLILFIDYWHMLDSHRSGEAKSMAASTLSARATKNQVDNLPDPKNPHALRHYGYDQIARYPWIPRFNIEYFLGVDGISMPLVLLTTIISFLAMLASWKIDRYVRGYCILFLILETGMIGTFLALDFFLFYIFWEVMLLPMYFLIGVWGGPRREYAAIKFFLYTLLGSVFILIALLGFYFTDVRDFVGDTAEQRQQILKQRDAEVKQRAGRTEDAGAYHTFDLIVLARAGRAAMKVCDGREDEVVNEILVGQKFAKAADREAERQAIKKRLGQAFFQPEWQITFFLLLFVGFAIKVPVFPFHTWLPDAHVEAPTPISMILAGVLLKMGGYGILRIAYPICPYAAYTLAVGLATFGIINIVYGAFTAMAQVDFKRLVAYSSISHMGYVILGIAVWPTGGGNQYWDWGVTGAMFQMLAHGISSAGMFFLVGVIYDRAHHRNLDNFRGLYEPMPLYGGVSAVIFFAALGLPGLCGFVGEFMVVLATWNFSAPGVPAYVGPLFAALAAGTVVITAAYILWTLQRVYMGTNPAYKDYPDIDPRELLCVIPLCVLAFIMGILPGQVVLNWTEPHLTDFVDRLGQLVSYRK